MVTKKLWLAPFLMLATVSYTATATDASAQAVRCPCFDETFIVGACKRFETCEVIDEGHRIRVRISCPTRTGAPGAKPWAFVNQPGKSRCSFGTQFGEGPVKVGLSKAEIEACFDELDRADITLACEGDVPSPPPR